MDREEIFKSYKGKKGNTSTKVLRPAQEPEVFRLAKKALRIIALRRMGIEDKPVEEINEDKFQYKQVAEIIYDLLNQNNFPIHIGLFGKWGSGKQRL